MERTEFERQVLEAVTANEGATASELNDYLMARPMLPMHVYSAATIESVLLELEVGDYVGQVADVARFDVFDGERRPAERRWAITLTGEALLHPLG